MVKRLLLSSIVTALLSLTLLLSCSSMKQNYYPGSLITQDPDTLDIPKPKMRNPVLAWQSYDRTIINQGEEVLDFDRDFRKLVNRPRQSYNINSFDEVPNSSWFTNRMGKEDLSMEEISKGVATTEGPDTSGDWIVSRPKVQGVSPGFWVEDKHGDQYILKFDPPGHPEIATAAAAMGGRYFHACGYNVTQETIVHWRPERLRIKKDLQFTDRTGTRRAFTQRDLDEILARVQHEPDGSIRSLASLLIKGDIGKFSYTGTRPDDPNDWCPHEHRRELRGLYVIASFINHFDVKDQNSLDAYVAGSNGHYVKHYLLDFGSTFGANSDKVKGPLQGYANSFDLRDVLVSLFTLGIKTWPWEHAKPIQYPSVGYFESEIFEPNKFDPVYPNPAFENMTARDAYWGAKIVMSFRDEHLRALVAAGELSDSAGAEYLFQTLRERRDKIGRYWFSKVNPLDKFSVEDKDGKLMINFTDLSKEYGLTSGATKHQLDIFYKGKKVIRAREFESDGFTLSTEDLKLLAGAYKPEAKGAKMEDHLYELRLRTKRGVSNWSRPLVLWIWCDQGAPQFQLVGVEHLDG